MSPAYRPARTRNRTTTPRQTTRITTSTSTASTTEHSSLSDRKPRSRGEKRSLAVALLVRQASGPHSSLLCSSAPPLWLWDEFSFFHNFLSDLSTVHDLSFRDFAADWRGWVTSQRRYPRHAGS